MFGGGGSPNLGISAIFHRNPLAVHDCHVVTGHVGGPVTRQLSTRHSDDVHVPLVVLAFAAPLRGLEAPALWNGEPLQWQDSGNCPCLSTHELQDHACKRWGHLRAESDSSSFLICGPRCTPQPTYHAW